MAARVQAFEGAARQVRNRFAGDAVEQVGHQDDVLAGRPVVFERIAADEGDPVGQAGRGDIFPAEFRDVREIEHGRLQIRIGLAEPDREGAGAAADVHQPFGAGQVDQARRRAAGAERARVLALAVETGFRGIRHPVGIGFDHGPGRRRLAGHHGFEAGHDREHLPVDLQAQIVSEVVLGALDQEGLRARRVRVEVALARHQAQGGQGGHQGLDAILRGVGFHGQFGNPLGLFRQFRKNTDMQCGE